MFQKVDNLENLIDRVAGVIQSLKDEKEQIAEELDVVREVLDEKEKEVSSLREERVLLEQRLSGLLEKMQSNCGLRDDDSVLGNVPSFGDDAETPTEKRGPFQGDNEARQGELTDRF
ncbi:MAG: hypothetical protein STSR0007_08530 [Thermovirga sp.]